MKKYLVVLLLLSGCASKPPTPPEEIQFNELLAVAPTYGIDALGLAKHKPKMVEAELDANSAIGYLDVTFGNPYPNLNLLLEGGKVAAVRAHLVDGTCIRNGVCPPGAPTYTSYSLLKARAQRLQTFAANFPAVKWYVSPFLEHDERRQSVVNRWYEILSRQVPIAKRVCSAFTGWCPAGVLIEKHGGPAGDVVSPDGESHTDINSVKFRTAGRVLNLSWIPRNNGRVSGEKTFISPLKRVNWPSRDDIRQQVLLNRFPAPVPNVAGCRTLNEREIGKPNAEDYGAGNDDGRGNKLLLILQQRYAKLDLRTIGGLSVGSMSYYGTFSGGGYRHYLGGKYGSNYTPYQLYKLFGGEWGLARSGGACFIINAIRRQGSYR